MNDIIILKGTKYGLQLVFDEKLNFEEIQKNLLQKLQSSNNFFSRGTTVFTSQNHFSEAQNKILQRIFREHGMLFSPELRISEPSSSTSGTKSNIIPQDQFKESQKMILINHTIRGGQEVKVDCSILICGNVNPGARVIAGGSVDIRGICWGSVHAGAFGDRSACVIADRLIPMQIRIADIVAHSSEEQLRPSERAERAFVKEDRIIFEIIAR